MNENKRNRLKRQYLKICVGLFLVIVTLLLLHLTRAPYEINVDIEQFPTLDTGVYQDLFPEETASAMEAELRSAEQEYLEGMEQLEQEIKRINQEENKFSLLSLFIAVGFLGYSLVELVIIIRSPKREEVHESSILSSMIKEVRRMIFTPRYSELVLFLMSLTFLILFFTSPTMRSDAERFNPDSLVLNNPFGYFVLAIFSLGMFFSIYHAFSRKPKTTFQKWTMLYFAVFANASSGLISGVQILQDTQGVLIVFPFWNITNAILLMSLYRSGEINIGNIQNEEVSLPQILFGSLIVIALLSFCQYVLNWHWATIFSVCVIYATNLTYVSRLFLSLFQRNVP
jgi:hypothetical protein